MTQFLDFFGSIPPVWRSLILAGGILLFWILEGVIPLSRAAYQRYRHAGINLVFTLTTLLVNLAFAFLIVQTAFWVDANAWGLVHVIDVPLWARVVGGLLLLDLVGAWLVHFVEHKTRWMWRFHLIHHTDMHVDVTTALRHHPGESVLRACFTVLAVFVAGTSIGTVMLYQSLSALFSQFNHANIRLPRAVERTLSWVIVTPDMHKVHHHWQQPQTDSNYGNIFAIWDRLFGTYDTTPVESIRFGIDTHMDSDEHDRLGNLFAIPFQPYREPGDSGVSGPVGGPHQSDEPSAPGQSDEQRVGSDFDK